MKTRLFLALISIVLIPNSVLADGGVFVDLDQHVYLPEQKAAIFWDGTNETLILSTKIKSENLSNMAWVIPLPSKTKPEIEEGDIGIFYDLAWVFGKYRSYSSFEPLVVVLFGLGVMGVICSVVSIIFYVRRKRRDFLYLFCVSCSVSLVSFVLLVAFMGSLAFTFMNGGVEPIEIKKVDIYDVAILKATNATALVGWLNGNGYVVPESTIPVLQDYCDEEDFYFVANKINLDDRYNTTAERSRVLDELKEGIATPLKIMFQPDEPFYPMKISGINDGTTRISVYVISSSPVTDKSGILSVYDGKQLSYGFSGEYKDYHVTLLNYNGYLKNLQGDSVFLQEEVVFWMQWWFWAIAVSGIVVFGGVVYFFKKRESRQHQLVR